MKKVLITGAKGNIGKALVNGLKGYELTFANLPKTDVRDYKSLEKIANKQDVLIHLAWNAETENFQTKTSDPNNILMAKNAYEVALKTGIKRVIIASSIHTDDFENYYGKSSLSPNRKPNPRTPYGKSKVKIEEMGKKYAKKGLEIICVRFGAVDTKGEGNSSGSALWLSQKDLLNLINKLINIKKIPNNFVIMYGVSNNKTRIHDYFNPFNWKPKDNSSKS
ncbi:MAG: NAD(P)-dependent oxidoreductase [Nanoarchaeota archaeon]